MIVLLQGLSVGAYGVWITNRTADSVVSTECLAEIDLAHQVERDLLNARIHFIYFVTIQKEGSLDKGWERFRNAQQDLQKLRDLVNRAEVLVPVRPDSEQLYRDFNSYKPALDHIIAAVQQNQNHTPEFAGVIKEWARLGGAMVDSAGSLSRHGSEINDGISRQAEARLRQSTKAMTIACFAGLLIGGTLVFFLTRDVTQALRRLIQELTGSAKTVAATSGQISKSAHSLADSASEQASSLEQTSASSAQINSKAGQNAAKSKAAARNMVEASECVGEANRNLRQMVDSMNEITSSSGRISKIIKVIDEIAFQTNILALNAAVEAARAGEAGLGFSVVADEVRNLSQRSSRAAKDIANLIEESIAKSIDGKSKVDQVAKALQSITESAGRVKALVDEVELGGEEQARGFEEVTGAILQMERITQTTASNADQSAAASKQLAVQSETLRAIVGRLAGMVHGGEEPV